MAETRDHWLLRLMTSPIATGVFFAALYILWGFKDGAESMETWLPDRLGYGVLTGCVAGILMYAKESAKRKARRRRELEEDNGSAR